MTNSPVCIATTLSLENLSIPCWTQPTLEDSVNTSITGNGGSSLTKHSVRACSTEMMKRTTGNPTTTTPTNLWCRSRVPWVTYHWHGHVFDRIFDLLQAEATSEGSHEYYNDVVDLLKARKETSSFNAGVTLSVYYVDLGLKGSREDEFIRNITQYSSQVSCVIDLQVDFARSLATLSCCRR